MISNTEELILTSLISQDLYGLQVVEAIEEVSGGEYKIGVGSLYPKLHKLEKQGMVKSYWGEDRPEERKGARRKYYKITGLGQQKLEEANMLRSNLSTWQPA